MKEGIRSRGFMQRGAILLCLGIVFGCGGGGKGSPPPAPTSLAAKPGYARVGLTWAASNGADSYKVYRSWAAGGPYDAISSPTGTTFTDTGVINGVPYYYVASAVNGSGESRYSNEAGTIPNPVADRELYVSDSGNSSLSVFDATINGDHYPLRTIAGGSTGLSSSGGIAVDTVNNEIVVPNTGIGINSITVYARTASGDAAPLRTIVGTSTGLLDPEDIAVDTVNNEIMVVNTGNNSILVFARTATGNAAPLRIINGASTGLNGPTSITVDTVNNEIIVGNTMNNLIMVFARTASGDAAPLRTISGCSSWAWGIAVDTVNNEIATAAPFNTSVMVCDRTASGAASPLRTIQGASTYLLGPSGVAIDTVRNELFVANSDKSITVYDRTATGNVSPLRRIWGGTTGLNYPSGVALTW